MYIFDLDGTLALTDHRQHLVQAEKPDWAAFFAACVDDEPNEPVIETLRDLWLAERAIEIWSGRDDAVRPQTEEWLGKHIANALGYDAWGDVGIFLRMRPHGDYTPDAEMKLAWLREARAEGLKRVTAVFDDRNSVVQMWRDNDVPCFQVAIGDF